MEKSSKTNHIYILVSIQEVTQFFHTMCFCFWLTHIKSNLRFYILPVIDYRIIHVDRIPHDISQKADGIFMEPFYRMDNHISAFFFVRPFTYRNHFSGSTVYHFPPSLNIIPVIDFQHIRIQMIHQMNLQGIFRCGMKS